MPIEETVGPIFHKAANIVKDGLIRRGMALRSAASAEMIGFGVMMGLEEIRTWFVNPKSSMIMNSIFYAKRGEQLPLPPPTFTPENTPPHSL